MVLRRADTPVLCKTERSQESAQSAQKRDLILSTLLTDAPNKREYPEPEARCLLTEPNTPAPALSACETVQNALAAEQLWDLGSRTSVSQCSVCTGHETTSSARDIGLQKEAGSFWGTSGHASAPSTSRAVRGLPTVDVGRTDLASSAKYLSSGPFCLR